MCLAVLSKFDYLLDKRPASMRELKRYVALCRIRVQHMEKDDDSENR